MPKQSLDHQFAALSREKPLRQKVRRIYTTATTAAAS